METLEVYNEAIAPRLLFPWSGEKIDAMAPEEFKADLPGARLIFDGTGFKLKSKENVLLHRVLFSAYHKETEGQVVFGKLRLVNVSFGCVLVSRAAVFRHYPQWFS